MTALLEKYPLLTVGLGQSKGGQARVFEWTHKGIQCVGKFLLPFAGSDKTGKWYIDDELTHFWATRRPELGGKSIADLIDGKKGCGATMWGADLGLLDDNGRLLKAVNYPSPNSCTETGQWIGQIPADWWHTTLGGAAQAGFQPLGVLRYLAQNLPAEVWPKVKRIVPIADLLFWNLTGQRGHDATMAQSQGLYIDGAVSAVEDKFSHLFPRGTLCPWQTFDTDYVYQGPNGVYHHPVSHDSALARPVGFSAARYGVWSGSWVGVSASLEGLEIVPCDATRELGLSFEGLNPPAVQTNTGMFGTVYDELVDQYAKQFGVAPDQKYEAAANAAQRQIDVRPLKSGDLKSKEAVLARTDGDVELALAAVIFHAADEVCKDLRKLAKVVGEPLDKVAIVGGWANNRAFCKAIERELQCEVIIPPHAADATEIGLGAEMLRRIVWAEEKCILTVAEILSQLPPMLPPRIAV